MGSSKKKKKSGAGRGQTVKAAAEVRSLPQGRLAGRVVWLLPTAAFLISLAVGVMMKHPVGFGVGLGAVNAVLAFFAAEMILQGDLIPRRFGMIEDKRVLLGLSAALPIAALLLVFAAVGIQPFGELTVLTGDMAEQYVPFLIARNRAFFSGGSLVYSDSFGLGSDVTAAMLYYTASPFTLLSFPFGAENAPEFMCLLQLLKTGAAGCAFGYFYMEKFRRKDVSVCVFSTMYAMMTYVVVNLLNIMWLDCIILLPLIILGMERLLEGKSPMMYIACLALAMFTNYYIAYMICIYLVLYYILYNFLREERLEIKAHVGMLAKFAVSSLLAAGAACVSLIPSAAAILQTSGNSDNLAEMPILNYSPVMLIGKLLWGSEISLANSTLPNIYCSMLALVMFSCFLMSKGIALKKKAAYSGLLTFIIICTFFKYTDVVWHGFHIPVGNPYRYSFLISFTVILAAAEAWEHVENLSFERVMYSLLGFIVIILANYLLDSEKSTVVFAVSGALAVAAAALLLTVSSKRVGRRAFAALAAVLVLADLTLSGADVINKMKENNYMKKSEYDNMLKVDIPDVEGIKVSDSDIYRIDDENSFMTNQGIYCNNSSLTYYATPNNGNAVRLMDALGYGTNEINKFEFNLYTPFSDSLLNLKYIMSADSSERKHLTLTDIESYGKHVYRNDLALPRAFAVKSDAERWSIEEGDPFELQNSLARLASGVEGDVYDILTNSASPEGDCHFTIKGGRYRAVYEIPREGYLFCYFKARKSDSISIRVGEIKYTIDGTTSCVFPLYEVKAGEKLYVEFLGSDGTEGYVSAALQNDRALTDALDILSRQPMQFEKYGDGFAEGNISAAEDCLLFTSIPYENGWEAELDGKPAEIVRIGGCLVGIRLHAGENHVKLKYSSKPLAVGLWVTLLSAAIIVIMIILKSKTSLADKMRSIIKN